MQPTHSKAHFGIGTAYAMMGEKEEAKSYYENAIIYDPEFISPYINLANLNMSTGEIETAKNLLLTALLKKPNLAGVHKNLGLILLQEKNIIGASKHLREYIRLMPLAPDAEKIQSFLKNEISSN
jgi:Flp pilus assembly protein TadD